MRALSGTRRFLDRSKGYTIALLGCSNQNAIDFGNFGIEGDEKKH